MLLLFQLHQYLQRQHGMVSTAVVIFRIVYIDKLSFHRNPHTILLDLFVIHVCIKYQDFEMKQQSAYKLNTLCTDIKSASQL